jgi:predicted DNA binding CopG/RHH family protein
MKNEYDFSQSIQNPYLITTKKEIRLNINSDTFNYFKDLSIKMGIPSQTLISSYLNECAIHRIEANFK